MRKSILLVLLFISGAQVLTVHAAPARQLPARQMDAATYSEELEKTESALERLQATSARRLADIQKLLPPQSAIRRPDGTSQEISNDEFQRILEGNDALDNRDDSSNSASGKGAPSTANPNAIVPAPTLRKLVTALRARRQDVNNWLTPIEGSASRPAEATRSISQFVTSGQIVVEPSAWEKFWFNIRQGWRHLLERIGKALFGRSTPNNSSLPSIDPGLIQFLFYSAIVALMGLIGYLLWKALGGRWGRDKIVRDVRYLEGEDAELLELPSDELRERARRFAEQGDYREALRHRYVALLVQFDERSIWRYDTRRTNWEHVSALRSDSTRAALVSPLVDLTRRFDRVRYGNATASPADWQRFSRETDSLETQAESISIAIGKAQSEKASREKTATEKSGKKSGRKGKGS